MIAESVVSGIKEATFEYYRPLVTWIAQRFKARLPDNIEIDDVIQWGMIGLMQALERHDPGRENEFKTYAEFRIRGNILDELRKQDLMGRHERNFMKLSERVAKEIEREHGRQAMPQQIAEKLEMTREELEQARTRVQERVTLSYDHEEFTPGDRKALLDSIHHRGEDLEAKIAAMQKLERICKGHKPIKQAAFKLYCVWGLTMKEIGELFGLSESRISQMIKQISCGIRIDEDFGEGVRPLRPQRREV